MPIIIGRARQRALFYLSAFSTVMLMLGFWGTRTFYPDLESLDTPIESVKRNLPHPVTSEKTLHSDALLYDQQLESISSKIVERLSHSRLRDKSGNYFVLENFLTANQVALQESYDVTIATQCTSYHLHYLVKLAETWQGPISVTVFTFDGDFIHAMTTVLYLHFCNFNVSRFITFHLAFPVDHSPDFNNLVDLVKNSTDCSRTQPSRQRQPFKNFGIKGIEYPINMLRSLALKTSLTSHVFYIDADLMPSENLRASLLTSFLRKRLASNTSSVDMAYIVPTFEVEWGKNWPGNKPALLTAWGNQEIRPFQFKECYFFCQKSTDYLRWRSLPEADETDVAYAVNYQPLYEPYVISQVPLLLFDESFKQYGFDRLSQICEMHVAGYQFLVLNNVYLVHNGLKGPSDLHPTWLKEDKRNYFLYEGFKTELKLKYPHSNRTCN